jgi:hypothetical protein
MGDGSGPPEGEMMMLRGSPQACMKEMNLRKIDNRLRRFFIDGQGQIRIVFLKKDSLITKRKVEMLDGLISVRVECAQLPERLN